VMAMGSALVLAITGGVLSSWGSLLARRGLGQSDALADGLADVGVVERPVDGRGGQGFEHELVAGRWGGG